MGLGLLGFGSPERHFGTCSLSFREDYPENSELAYPSDFQSATAVDPDRRPPRLRARVHVFLQHLKCVSSTLPHEAL